MKIWLLSDIHLEINRSWELPDPLPQFDVLVVAGDLIPKAERGVRWLLERLPDRDIVLVAGNHERYGEDEIVTIEKAIAAASGSRLRVLENSCAVIGDVKFIGATCWTDFDLFGDPAHAMAVADAMMNDFRFIRTENYGRRFTPADALARHLASRAFIENELARTPDGLRRVVVQHHGCHAAAARIGLESHPISAAYTSRLDDEIAAWGADLWCHGHTHRTDDRIIGPTRVVTNGLGYGPYFGRLHWDNPDFDPRFVIDV